MANFKSERRNGASIAKVRVHYRWPAAVVRCPYSSGIRRSPAPAAGVRHMILRGQACCRALAGFALARRRMPRFRHACARYPVLLSLPGWNGLRGENTTFVQDLASRGFVIAAIGYDDPACAGVDVSAGGAVATDMDFSSEAAFEHTLAVAHEKINRVAEGGFACHRCAAGAGPRRPGWPVRRPA